jgi:hypothetical protein
MYLKADLHIHSVLSPCGGLDMSPAAIVKKALEKKMDIIALADHNSAGNLKALEDAALEKIALFFGLEIQSASETHLLTLFGNREKAEAMGDFLYSYLPDIPNNPEYFGDQVVVDAEDRIIKMEDKLLLQSVEMEIEEIIEEVHGRGGVVFFSHIDRDSYSVISQLGFIPSDSKIDGVEISRHLSLEQARKKYARYGHWPFVTNSDAHLLEDVGCAFTTYKMQTPSFEEFCMALQGREGRRVCYDA